MPSSLTALQVRGTRTCRLPANCHDTLRRVCWEWTQRRGAGTDPACALLCARTAVWANSVHAHAHAHAADPFKPLQGMQMHTQLCAYAVIRRMGRQLGAREVLESGNWSLYWADCGVPANKIASLKSYQVCNHFPGMLEICRKDLLGRNIMRMNKAFPDEYSFVPRTWELPYDYGDMQAYCRESLAVRNPDSGSVAANGGAGGRCGWAGAECLRMCGLAWTPRTPYCCCAPRVGGRHRRWLGPNTCARRSLSSQETGRKGRGSG